MFLNFGARSILMHVVWSSAILAHDFKGLGGDEGDENRREDEDRREDEVSRRKDEGSRPKDGDKVSRPEDEDEVSRREDEDRREDEVARREDSDRSDDDHYDDVNHFENDDYPEDGDALGVVIEDRREEGLRPSSPI